MTKTKNRTKKYKTKNTFLFISIARKKLKTAALFLFGVTQSKLENWRFQVESFQD